MNFESRRIELKIFLYLKFTKSAKLIDLYGKEWKPKLISGFQNYVAWFAQTQHIELDIADYNNKSNESCALF